MGMYYLLQAAWAPTGGTAERSDEAYDLSVSVIFDLHVKATQRTAAVACAAVVFLFGRVDLLAEAVLDLILVIGLKANDCCRKHKNTHKILIILICNSFT